MTAYPISKIAFWVLGWVALTAPLSLSSKQLTYTFPTINISCYEPFTGTDNWPIWCCMRFLLFHFFSLFIYILLDLTLFYSKQSLPQLSISYSIWTKYKLNEKFREVKSQSDCKCWVTQTWHNLNLNWQTIWNKPNQKATKNGSNLRTGRDQAEKLEKMNGRKQPKKSVVQKT